MKKKLLNIIKANIFFLLSSIICLVMISFISVRLPIYLQKFIDSYISKETQITASRINTSFLNSLHVYLAPVILYCIFGLLKKGLTIVQCYLTELTNWNFFNALRKFFFVKIFSFDEYFFKENSFGQLCEYSERDINTISSYYKNNFYNNLINVCTIAGIILTLLFKNFRIGIIFFVYILIVFFSLYIAIKNNSSVLKDYISSSSTLFGKLSEVLNAKKDINLIPGAEEKILNNISGNYAELKKITISSQKYLYNIWSITLFIATSSNIIFLAIAGFLYFTQKISLGTAFLIYTYSSMLKRPIEYFQSDLQAFLKAYSSYLRLKKLLKYTPSTNNGSIEFTGPLNTIKFQNVSMKYKNGNDYVFKNLNLTIKKEQILGIKGKSGIGKSTLCKLLIKAFIPTEGEILFEEKKLNDLTCESVRKRIFYLNSEAYLFKGSIYENLVLNNTSITKLDIEEKLKQIGLEESLYIKILDLQILDTPLSDGQKQLINILRIVCSKADVIILDEAFSSISDESYIIIRNLIEALKNEKIFIIISHNERDLNLCNYIYEMENV